ncbi:MAG: cysteine hydrolase [Candidatus Eisenbacteria bacterium]|uniref:Cysteine hydrolase n=1 Tax=Eiseniibacteriota bacterium TaxID=2212470 RepID=A0A948RRX6_UNCEI|nr:cysteine hydrolase [Candidatus Eisenbacteria bacterium]MBU1948274.1 cysteine hydrolase [Candidatus Eisenbacteria bacterium]MBU2689870.1 cysteine hydrolase [Candidatus Eisenbacteria bacterium]
MKRLIVIAMLVILATPVITPAQDEEPRPIRPALLVIDVQNKFIPMMDEDEQESSLRMINGAIWLFRRHELPVIRVYHTDPEWGPDPESEEFQFPESVFIQDDDPKIVKNYPSAFVKTELDELLKQRGINTLFLCGLSATGCVLATYHGAMEREYKVFMIEGALLSRDAEQTETIKDICSSVGWQALELLLDGFVK